MNTIPDMIELIVAPMVYVALTAYAVYFGVLKAVEASFGQQEDADSYTVSPPDR